MTEMGKSLQKYLAVLEKYVTLQPQMQTCLQEPKKSRCQDEIPYSGTFFVMSSTLYRAGDKDHNLTA